MTMQTKLSVLDMLLQPYGSCSFGGLDVSQEELRLDRFVDGQNSAESQRDRERFDTAWYDISRRHIVHHCLFTASAALQIAASCTICTGPIIRIEAPQNFNNKGSLKIYVLFRMELRVNRGMEAADCKSRRGLCLALVCLTM